MSIGATITLFLITLLFLRAESISRTDFPEGFIFGTASSAHQVYLISIIQYNLFIEIIQV